MNDLATIAVEQWTTRLLSRRTTVQRTRGSAGTGQSADTLGTQFRASNGFFEAAVQQVRLNEHKAEEVPVGHLGVILQIGRQAR